MFIFYYFLFFHCNNINFCRTTIHNLNSQNLELQITENEEIITDNKDYQKIKNSKEKPVNITILGKLIRLFSLIQMYDAIFFLQIYQEVYGFLKEKINKINNSNLSNLFYILMGMLPISLIIIIKLKFEIEDEEKINELFFSNIDEIILTDEEKEILKGSNQQKKDIIINKKKNSFIELYQRIPASQVSNTLTNN